MILLAVDPGEVHVGLAYFQFGLDDDGDETADCTRTCEVGHTEGIDWIAAGLLNNHFDVLVVEQFNLYPDKAMAQTGSTMPTCEMIGCIKWAHRLDARRRSDVLAGIAPKRPPGRVAGAAWDEAHDLHLPVPLILQPAAIQEPTSGLLRHRGIKSVARASGAGPHALSAELHGWAYLLRRVAQGT